MEPNNTLEKLEKDRQRFEALVKLQDFNQSINNTFKKEFKQYFNKNKFDYIPNFIDFINDMPEKEDDTYDFWIKFINKYPGYNLKFRDIYNVIYGAHYNIPI